MFSDFKSEVKLLLIVAAVSVVIAVGGILLLQGVVRNQVSPMPAPAPSPQAQVQVTEGWQTYRNEEFGFEVQYPGSLYYWSAQEGMEEIVLFSSGDRNIQISISSFDSSAAGITFCQDVLITETRTSRCERLITEQQIGVEIDWESTENTAVATIRNFILTLSVDVPGKIDEETKIFFRQILSTFRFVE